MRHTVVYFAHGDAFGGAEQVLLTTLVELDRRRWNPVLFYNAEPAIAPLLEGAQSLGVRLEAVPRMTGKQSVTRVPQFIRRLRAERPAVFHAHLSWPLACKYELIAAALARIPAVIATEHSFGEIRNRRSCFVERLVCTQVDRYIAVSDDLAQRLCQCLQYPNRKVKVIHNGIPLESFSHRVNPELRAALTAAKARPIVLTIARLHKRKGIHYLLEAIAQIPQVVLVIVGDGPHRAVFESKVRTLRLDDRVIFLGYRKDIPDLLASCDVFVLPSLFEGFPLSVLEAMAAGKPVIASAVGGTAEIVIDNETGILVPPADPAALEKAIRNVLSDHTLCQNLGAAGKARVHREFSAAKMVQRVTQIYEELLYSREASNASH